MGSLGTSNAVIARLFPLWARRELGDRCRSGPKDVNAMLLEKLDLRRFLASAEVNIHRVRLPGLPIY